MDLDKGLVAKAAGWASETRCVINGVEFQFRKLLAMEAFDVMEDIRTSINGQAVASALAAMEVEGETISMQQIGMALAALPRLVSKPALEGIRRKMFRVVDFRKVDTSDTMAPIIRDGVDDQPRAFELAGPLAVYQVLVRSLAVNFTEYLGGALSALDRKSPDTSITTTQT